MPPNYGHHIYPLVLKHSNGKSPINGTSSLQVFLNGRINTIIYIYIYYDIIHMYIYVYICIYIYINRPFSIATCDTGGNFPKKTKHQIQDGPLALSRRLRGLPGHRPGLWRVGTGPGLGSSRVHGPGGVSLRHPMGYPAWYGLVNIQKTDGKDPPC